MPPINRSGRNKKCSGHRKLPRSISSVLLLNSNVKKKSPSKCNLLLPPKTLDSYKNKIYHDIPKSRNYCQNASIDPPTSKKFSSPFKESANERFQRHNNLKKRIRSPSQSNEPPYPCAGKYSSNNRMLLKRPTLPTEKIKNVRYLNERENIMHEAKVGEFPDRQVSKKRKCFWYNKDLKLPRAVTPGIALKQKANDEDFIPHSLKPIKSNYKKHLETNINLGYHSMNQKIKKKHKLSSMEKKLGNIQNLRKNSILKKQVKRKKSPAFCKKSSTDLQSKQNSNQNISPTRYKRSQSYLKRKNCQIRETSENSGSLETKAFICKICKRKLKKKLKPKRNGRNK